MAAREISVPFTDQEELLKLKIGDRVLLTGTIYTARDAAHKRMIESLEENKGIPFDLAGQVIYYVGPTPPKPDQVIGSAGPTTSGRMDKYAPRLMELGLKGMIGKGRRNEEVKQAMTKHKAAYFAAVGGAAALIAKSIKSCRVIAYEDLGPEAVYQLQVEKFPVIVANDAQGGDIYEAGEAMYRVE